MWMRRTLAGLAGVLVVWLGIGGGSALAAVPKADLAIGVSTSAGIVGQSVDVRYVIRNNGPGLVAPFTFVLDIVAPRGTQIISAGGGACEAVVAGEHLRCRFGFQLASGERHALALRLKVVTAPSGCGRMGLAYGNDPRPANNVANVRVTVDGKPGNCTATSSPTPKPTRTKASATPSPSFDATQEPAVDQTSEQPTPVVGADVDDVGGGTSLGSILVIGGGAILVGLGGLLIWRMLRKEPEDDVDGDATGPIYG
jgi:hypothetical protein